MVSLAGFIVPFVVVIVVCLLIANASIKLLRAYERGVIQAAQTLAEIGGGRNSSVVFRVPPDMAVAPFLATNGFKAPVP